MTIECFAKENDVSHSNMISHGLFLPHVNIVLHKIDLEAHLGLRADISVILHSLHCLLLAISK